MKKGDLCPICQKGKFAERKTIDDRFVYQYCDNCGICGTYADNTIKAEEEMLKNKRRRG